MSAPPPSGVTKPKRLLALKNLIVPVVIPTREMVVFAALQSPEGPMGPCL